VYLIDVIGYIWSDLLTGNNKVIPNGVSQAGSWQLLLAGF